MHGHTSSTPLSNGNSTGIGVTYRDSEGEMKLLTTGVDFSRKSTVGNVFSTQEGCSPGIQRHKS